MYWQQGGCWSRERVWVTEYFRDVVILNVLGRDATSASRITQPLRSVVRPIQTILTWAEQDNWEDPLGIDMPSPTLAPLTPEIKGVVPKEKTLKFAEKTEDGSKSLGPRNSITIDEILAQTMRNLDVVVVGAGIGGLAAALALATDGHRVKVLDGVKEFAEVGAGIRVPPNSSRLCRAWGVDLDSVPKQAARGIRFVDWKDNILLDVPYADMASKYGTPYYLFHRADFIAALLAAAKMNNNVQILTGNKVVEYDLQRPAVKTEEGTWYPADLIVSAEGIKSSIRDTINGTPIEPVDTGDVAYRILVPSKPLLEDPETRHLVENPWAVHWLGPEGHAVGYPLRNGELYNIIIDITHATDCGQSVGKDEWKRQIDNSELVERFKDWCKPVRKLCGLTGEYLKWKLVDFPTPLKRWSDPNGKVVLLGDAVHPMMPYLAQGAAQAIEDAATIRAALATYDDLPQALEAYQKQRAPRAYYTAKNTRVLQEWLHLYDGPSRDRRDEMMRHDSESNPIFWGYTPRKDWLFGYDAGKMHTDEENQIPALPPCLPEEDSVYSKTKTEEAKL
ncbi:hypothetical protein B7463_g3975, partial [Scytalidium lignicola]